MKSAVPDSPPTSPALLGLPSVDRLLRHVKCLSLVEKFGRQAVVEAIRVVLARWRASPAASGVEDQMLEDILGQAALDLARNVRPSLRRVFNLTGTVLHTNLGRASLPQEALDAILSVAGGASNLEFDLQAGKRGDRDDHVEALLARLTGAQAATVVNNNAAALLLVLNSLARNKEVPTSRGELIEIGGAFRLPDIMSRSGCRLREVGTTNRTHLRDFAEAIGPKTALVMKVHTSNFSIEGFTAAVPEADLANLCHQHGLPFMVDLGAGTLVDLRTWGLPYEPTPAQSIADGADLVTFSGDKLLGGPQAGIIVGRADLIEKIKRNPLKRALRVDKMTIAALEAVLRLYANPDQLAQRLPTLRALARPLSEIQMTAERVAGSLRDILRASFAVAVVDCESEIGSGALPTKRIASAALSLIPLAARGRGTALGKMASALRGLPTPVIGRVHQGALLLDCRCLEDEAAFTSQLALLGKAGAATA